MKLIYKKKTVLISNTKIDRADLMQRPFHFLLNFFVFNIWFVIIV